MEQALPMSVRNPGRSEAPRYDARRDTARTVKTIDGTARRL